MEKVEVVGKDVDGIELVKMKYCTLNICCKK